MPATLSPVLPADLLAYEGKAELIAGRVVPQMPTGFRPGVIGGRIFIALAAYVAAVGRGAALPDNVGFAVPELSSGRETFSPDASYYDGPLPADDFDFIPGAPTFAVEVRSKHDYGPSAEIKPAAKRLDYFEAGTLVVWDVDPAANIVIAYRADRPEVGERFTTIAHAEPALPGWTLPPATLFAG